MYYVLSKTCMLLYLTISYGICTLHSLLDYINTYLVFFFCCCCCCWERYIFSICL